MAMPPGRWSPLARVIARKQGTTRYLAPGEKKMTSNQNQTMLLDSKEQFTDSWIEETGPPQVSRDGTVSK